MDAIAKNVYIEDRYVGVTLGVITQPRGLIQIDHTALMQINLGLMQCTDPARGM